MVLVPNCDSHDHKLDLSQGLSRGEYLLLEQWRFQLIPKRFEDYNIPSQTTIKIGCSSRKLDHGVGPASALFQAIKSYLHFSQLSAWLNQTKGNFQSRVEFR